MRRTHTLGHLFLLLQDEVSGELGSKYVVRVLVYPEGEYDSCPYILLSIIIVTQTHRHTDRKNANRPVQGKCTRKSFLNTRVHTFVIAGSNWSAAVDCDARGKSSLRPHMLRGGAEPPSRATVQAHLHEEVSLCIVSVGGCRRRLRLTLVPLGVGGGGSGVNN